MSSSGGVATQMAHAHTLARTNTAPVFQTRSTVNGLPGLSHTMSTMSSQTSRSSQLSGSTAFNSSSASISSMSSSATVAPPVNGGPVQATNNIINQKADASRSLYQICVNLRQRLAQVPGFDTHLNDSDDEDEGQDMDPVSSLWRCLRKGTPLMTIYNAIHPPDPLKIDDSVAEAKRPKIAAFKFVEACLKDLKLPPGECFALSDLFGDDTTGFVKVTQVINIVLDVAGSRGFLLTTEAGADAPTTVVAGSQMSYRDHVVKELVDTERKYVQDLENLHELKKIIEQKGVIPGDVVHDIFLNINAILDFQRRFLIKIETTNSQPDARQEWGLPFTNYEEAFGIYQPFIANQRKAASIAMREFDKISMAEHPVVVDFNTLDGFLLKPMQRLVKYPLLLKDLRDKTGADDETKADLTAGIEAANRVLAQANNAVDLELRNEALYDLCTRVDDWKNHRVDHFGDLLLHGHFPVVTGKNDVQKEYTIYLFERILLCCKEVNPNKSKDKLMGTQKDKKDKKDKNKKTEMNKNAKLQLKGRIFMTNVTEVVSLGKQGSYTVQIFWKGDPGVENFIIKFSNEETMKKWYSGVDGQRKEHTASINPSTSPDAGPPDFAWMRNQGAAMPNPYAQAEEDDDDEDSIDPLTIPYANQPSPSQSLPGMSGIPGMPRNASTGSLRSRSATGDSQPSMAGIARAPPPRFPMSAPNAPLSVQTQLNSGGYMSPGERGGDSYFSPVAESPASSRTSTASSMYPFPRQATPQGGWEDSNRYTAPAMARAPSRESNTPVNGGYQMNGRTPQRPSLPAQPNPSQAALAQQRSRSYSTPDINAQIGGRRLPNGASVPAVPGIPAHLHPAYDAGIPRSQNNSPSGLPSGPTSGVLPMRTSTNSPGLQRERQLAQGSPYPNAPGYNRSNTTQIPMSMSDSRTTSPPLTGSVPQDDDMGLPTQLKVKVNSDGNYVTLVVAFNITYQSLIDRIDAKVGRFSNNAIAKGTMRLRYRDEDGDFVTIESDDDIQIAFQEWRESQKLQYQAGQLGEIELFCLSVDS
ncbi:CDC24 calponin [Coleophoma cylindrospora]|uniref:CDC24 calponin n=1 Tax=Coleophoma cylindrospora TaxID=1849047 RepID=A0A3D8QTX2_9HELO|nr:CDC24 calponin [Coleophoma cylindrospora]